ncbi:MAG: 1-acyl-sn-glycerol-3-phosphate acyltransferase [Lachnospiraceae bacterium]|nr:1-acyl-sn-glycerol-3-phosphate acyltransferase [Lachnospiraceae bacterium]
MRTIIILLFLLCFFIVGYPLLGIFWLIRKRNPYQADICQLRIVQFALKIITILAGTKVVVIGEENIPKDEAVLYVANHRSMFDIILTYARVPNLTGYISKIGVKKVPALRAWMKRLHCLFMDRDDIKQSLMVILEAIDLVKNGTSVFIFPEGTRNREREDTANVLDFKDGSFKVSQKTGCKIIPVAITGSASIFETQFPWVKKRTVILEYGKPILLSELSKEDQKHSGTYFQNKIHGMLEEHKNIIANR